MKNGFAPPTPKKVGALKINRLQRIARPGTTVRRSWTANLLSKSNAVLRTPLSTYHPTTAPKTQWRSEEIGRRNRWIGKCQVSCARGPFPSAIEKQEQIILHLHRDWYAFAALVGCNRSIAGRQSDCPSRDSPASSFKHEPQSGKKTMKAEVLDSFRCALPFGLGLLLHSAKRIGTIQVKAQKLHTHEQAYV